MLLVRFIYEVFDFLVLKQSGMSGLQLIDLPELYDISLLLNNPTNK